MLNRPKSSKISWLKYSVFFIAVLTIASAFARPKHINALSQYVPQPFIETIVAMAEPTKKPLQPQPDREVERATALEVNQLDSSKESLPKLVKKNNQQLDSINQLSRPDTVRVSPSRYMVYQGDYLYWIVTPKTTFDDFALMKHEFEKHGYKMQVQTLKYDPVKAYISDIKVTIIRPTAGVSDFEETSVNGGPIRSYGGYNGLNMLKTTAAVGSYPFNDDFLHIPQGLAQIAHNEELPINKSINDQRMENLIAEGQRKYGHLGLGFRKFNQKEIIKQSTHNSSLGVTSDGSLSINEGPGWIIKAFINNEPVTLEEVRKLAISNIYTFAVILGYDSALQKRSGTDYFLFYVN